MVLKNDSNLAADASSENSALVSDSASTVSPIAELNAANREAIGKSATVVHVQRNDQIKAENSHRWLTYLVEGTLTLYSGKDEAGVLNARTPESLKPLFLDKAAYQSVKTSTVAKLVRFGREQMDLLLREQQKNAVSVIGINTSELDNIVFDDIIEAMSKHTLALAITPESAKTIFAAHQKFNNIPELAEIIQSDAGLALHLVDLANRVASNKAERTTSIRGAITRLGVKETQNAALAILKKNTMQASSEVIKNRLDRYVNRTSLCVSIVQVLTKQVSHLKPEVAALVALSSDIGELAILTCANKHPERFTDEQKLAAVIDNLRVIVSTWIVDAWGFPSQILESAQKSRDWYRAHDGEITYTDLVTAALLIIQSEIPDVEHSSIPSANNLLLARRLQQSGIDLTSPKNILKDAGSKLIGLQTLLKAS